MKYVSNKLGAEVISKMTKESNSVKFQLFTDVGKILK